MKFDPTGKYLSLGDHAGRIIIFELTENKKKVESYEYYAEVSNHSIQFQSHVREFDPLRSIDVDETITDINWLQGQGKYMKLLTTNTKNIKLWKIFEKAEKKVVKSAGKELTMPKVQTQQSSLVANVQ